MNSLPYDIAEKIVQVVASHDDYATLFALLNLCRAFRYPTGNVLYRHVKVTLSASQGAHPPLLQMVIALQVNPRLVQLIRSVTIVLHLDTEIRFSFGIGPRLRGMEDSTFSKFLELIRNSSMEEFRIMTNRGFCFDLSLLPLKVVNLLCALRRLPTLRTVVIKDIQNLPLQLLRGNLAADGDCVTTLTVINRTQGSYSVPQLWDGPQRIPPPLHSLTTLILDSATLFATLPHKSPSGRRLLPLKAQVTVPHFPSLRSLAITPLGSLSADELRDETSHTSFICANAPVLSRLVVSAAIASGSPGRKPLLKKAQAATLQDLCLHDRDMRLGLALKTDDAKASHDITENIRQVFERHPPFENLKSLELVMIWYLHAGNGNEGDSIFFPQNGWTRLKKIASALPSLRKLTFSFTLIIIDAFHHWGASESTKLSVDHTLRRAKFTSLVASLVDLFSSDGKLSVYHTLTYCAS